MRPRFRRSIWELPTLRCKTNLKAQSWQFSRTINSEIRAESKLDVEDNSSAIPSPSFIRNAARPPNVFVTETLRLNRECATSKRPVSFLCFEKRQPGMVLSENLFQFPLTENHARG